MQPMLKRENQHDHMDLHIMRTHSFELGKRQQEQQSTAIHTTYMRQLTIHSCSNRYYWLMLIRILSHEGRPTGISDEQLISRAFSFNFCAMF